MSLYLMRKGELMKLRNHVINTTINILSQYAETKLPYKVKYAIGKNMQKMTMEYQFYEKQLKELFDEFGKKDSTGELLMNGNLPEIEPDNTAIFEKELSDLLNIEVTIDNLHFISEEDLYYEDNDNFEVLTIKQITELASILCAPEEEKTNDETDLQ